MTFPAQSDPGHDPALLPGFHRDKLRDVRAVLIAGVVTAIVSGLGLGVVWWEVCPRLPNALAAEQIAITNQYLTADIAFAGLALLAGVAVTIGLVVMRREHLMATLVASVLAGFVGSLLIWQVGIRLESFARQVHLGIVNGVPTQDLTLTLPAVLLVWPIVACAIIAGVTFADWLVQVRAESSAHRSAHFR